MKILRKMTQFAKMSFVVGNTTKYNKGEIQVTDNVINEVYKSMISAIKIDSPEIDLVAKRNKYIPNMTYPQYDGDTNDTYHVTVDDNIYICISNNNGSISTEAPTSTLLNNIIKSDGYVWSYIGKINTSEIDQETDYISIPDKIYNTSEIGNIARLKNIESTTLNFDEQPQYKFIGTGTNAILDIMLDENGDIKYISTANGGFGYSDEDIVVISDNFDGVGAEVSLNIIDGKVQVENFSSGSGYNDCSILVIGDGTGATINYTTLNGSITDVEVVDGGTNYTWAKAFVFSSERAIIASVDIMPMNGKSTNPEYLLRANTWRIKKTLDISKMDGYIYDGMDFNLISVVDQYDENYIAGLNNKYDGDIQLNYSTEVKEVFSVNKVEKITINNNEKITLTLTIKLDDNKICQK